MHHPTYLYQGVLTELEISKKNPSESRPSSFLLYTVHITHLRSFLSREISSAEVSHAFAKAGGHGTGRARHGA